MRVRERGVRRDAVVRYGRVRRGRGRRRRGLVGERVTVTVPGGDLDVELGATVRLGGPVVHVFDVDVDLDVLRGASMSQRHLDRGRRRLTATEVDLGVVHQRALLVGTGYGLRTADEAEASLEELAAAWPIPPARSRSRSSCNGASTPDPALYVGKGKAEELRQLAEALDVDVVIFDDELTPAQQRNLEQLFERDVVDRVALILDIFAQHAASQEGMVQVELAQLRYRLPRLRGRGVTLRSRAAGSAPAVPARPSSRWIVGASRRVKSRSSSAISSASAGAGDPAKGTAATRALTVALVGYTNAGLDAAQSPHRRDRAGGGPTVLHPRPRDPTTAAPGG